MFPNASLQAHSTTPVTNIVNFFLRTLLEENIESHYKYNRQEIRLKV